MRRLRRAGVSGCTEDRPPVPACQSGPASRAPGPLPAPRASARWPPPAQPARATAAPPPTTWCSAGRGVGSPRWVSDRQHDDEEEEHHDGAGVDQHLQAARVRVEQRVDGGQERRRSPPATSPQLTGLRADDDQHAAENSEAKMARRRCVRRGRSLRRPAAAVQPRRALAERAAAGGEMWLPRTRRGSAPGSSAPGSAAASPRAQMVLPSPMGGNGADGRGHVAGACPGLRGCPRPSSILRSSARHPGRALAARGALAARLLGVELG